jgi:hypothetical protein
MFSANDSVVVITTADEGFQAFNYGGEFRAEFGHGTLVDISADGETIAIWHKGTVRVYRGSGRVGMFETPDSVRVIDLSADGTHLGWIDAKQVQVRRLGHDSVLFHKMCETPKGTYRTLAIGDGAAYIALGIDIDNGAMVSPEARHTGGSVAIYSQSGQLICSRDLTYTNWKPTVPRLQFLNPSHIVSVTTPDTTFFLDLSDREGSH